MVVGAASGICRSVAIKVALNGAIVACADIDDSGNEETVGMIQEQGGNAFAVHMDMSKSSDVKQAMAASFSRTGKISILINGAAVISYNSILETTDEEWQRIIDVDLGGYFYTLREVHSYMKAGGGGKIVNFSSSTAWSGTGFAGPGYTASKAGIVGLTKYCAGQWARDNIRVNAICPGLTITPIVTLPDGSIKDKELHEANVPLGRLADPMEQANVVLFLVSDESSYMTGTTVHVNGGKYMYGS